MIKVLFICHESNAAFSALGFPSCPLQFTTFSQEFK